MYNCVYMCMYAYVYTYCIHVHACTYTCRDRCKLIAVKCILFQSYCTCTVHKCSHVQCTLYVHYKI